MSKNKSISKNASIIYRLGQPFFDRKLEAYHIGCGQQFFLMKIKDYPGISLLELAGKGYYDKGTTARAVKKLEEQGYIHREIDASDKRIHYLYINEKAISLLEATRQAIEEWHQILTADFDSEQIVLVEDLLDKMAENAYATLKKDRR